jgi:hypothetical protein
MARTRSVEKARKAYKDFSGHVPQKVRTSRLPDKPVTGWEMGPVVGIAYQAKRDGQTKEYFHEFRKDARPRLVSQDDGRQLYIDGGRYKVTDRGIEDMPALFVVNPSRRKGAAPKKRKAKPMARARRRRATRQVAVFRANPVRRRRRRSTTRARARTRTVFLRNPARRRRRRSVAVRRFRRNPSARRGLGGALNFGKSLLPAIGIGVGAVGAEIIMGYLPIPANFKTGVLRHVTKGVVAITAGMLIGKVLRQKRLGNFIALGGVVIAAHDALKEVITSRMPAVPFGAYMPVGATVGSLGQYVNTPPGSLGYYSPAGTVDYSAMGGYGSRVSGGDNPDFQA